MLTLHSKSASAAGTASCVLTPDELQAYPDSLLSSIATSCKTTDGQDSANADSSSSSTVSINLQEVPGWPCSVVRPVEAAAVITSLYRDGRFPLSWLEQQLTAAGSSSSSTTGLYNSLTGLLSFLNLPGSLLEWLPIKSLTLRHMMGTGMDLLTFYYKAAAMQAVDSMLSYNPLMTCSSSGGKQRVSLFLITTSGICSAPLNMFAVDVAVSSSDISSIANAPGADDRASCGIIELSSGLDTRIDFKTTAVAELSTVQASAGSSSTVLAATTCVEEWKSAQALADAAVGPQHPLFGQHVKEALLAAGSSSKIPKVFGSGVVTVVVLDSYGNAFKGRSAPATVWFVSW